ncbi:MAG: PAS domain S-box protein [Desulfobacteraceae bacterium]|nr:MAG: PAS domain S-box protein [Desulfobacteraceae bacterium]
MNISVKSASGRDPRPGRKAKPDPSAAPGSAHLELILEATDQGIYVLDALGRCTLFNRAAAAMTGWLPEEGLGRNIHELIHHTRPGGSPHPPEECSVLGVLRTGKGVHRDGDVYWRRDGTPFPAEYSSSPIIENGRTIGAVVVFMDITERRRLEKTLRDREKELRLITDAGPTLIAYVDSDCRYRWVNKTYARWVGLASEEVRGRHFREVIGEAAWRLVQPYARRALNGEVVAHEQQLPLQNGPSWVRGTFTPHHDESGEVRGFVEHAIDIGEGKEAEETYRATLNILADFDEERQNVQLLQKATLNLLEDMHDERNRLDQTQRATLNILEDFDQEKGKLRNLQQATMNLLEDVDEERRNFQLIQKATLNLLEDMNTEREKADQTQRALINILDDVEVERAKSEQSKALLESVNRELEAFSYSVSHDLRAPLRAISGFAEALMEDWAAQLDDEGKRYLGLVQDNAHKMGQLIDDLLAFSRLGRQPMTKTDFDVGTLAEAVFEELAAHRSQRHIEFIVGPVPALHADKALIQQVLVNLISNAVKFTKTREKACIEVGYRRDADRGAYYVRDNGVGFDMLYVGKLFGVFQRLHSDTEFEGTGVGLALVYRIITRHGGKVWAEGQEGHGATFYFSLPGIEK